jgi:hypothetical protein
MCPALDEQLHPGRASTKKIGAHHARERPALEMLSLDRRVENDPLAARSEAHPQFDVLDAWRGVALLIEATCGKKFVAPDRPQSGPERVHGSSTRLMDMVVEKVTEAGNQSVGTRIVVIGAEYRNELGVSLQRPAKPSECIRMDLDVGVEEDEHIGLGSMRAFVPRACRAQTSRLLHENDLLGWVVGTMDRVQAPPQRRSEVSGWNHDAERRHRTILGFDVERQAALPPCLHSGQGSLREQADLTGTDDRLDVDVWQGLAPLESYVVAEGFRGWDPRPWADNAGLSRLALVLSGRGTPA